MENLKDQPRYTGKKAAEKIADIKYQWFKMGQQSVLRKNKSGCCCILDDGGNVISACGAHEEWLKKHLQEKRELPSKTAKEIFEAAQWDMIKGVRYLDENECIALIEKLRSKYE